MGENKLWLLQYTFKSDEEPAEILPERTNNPFRPLGSIITNQRIPQKKRYCELDDANKSLITRH
eukprot:scaffold23084_cov153-Skeletonema_dohrnii-CCMP3373.AAC.1